MMSARARVLSNPGVDTVRQWIAEPGSTGFAGQSAPRKAAILYASALGSSQLRDAKAARATWVLLEAQVRGDAPAQRQAQLLKAEIELAAGDADAALAALPPGANEQRPELLLRTRALLKAGRSGEVAGALQTWIANHPRDATVWQLMATVWQANGQPLRAVRAEAEAHATRYDYAAAVDRFKAGQDLARRSGASADHFEASIIDTRLKAVESLLREQTAER